MADTTYGAVSNNELSQKVELSISCLDLPRLDKLSKSDPMVITYLQQESTNGPYLEVGRTELLKNDHNPKFAVTVPVKYFFEEVQRLRFVVLDVDDPKVQVSEYSKGKDLIGYVECTMGDIMGSRGSTIERDIINKEHPSRSNGKIKVAGFEVSSGTVNVKFKLSASNLDKKDFLGKSDPYVVLHRADSTGQSFSAVHKTEYVKQNLNPVWNDFTVSLALICGNDINLPILFEVFDWDKDGGHDLIGTFKTTIAEMRVKKEFDIIEPKKAGKKGYKNSGVLAIREMSEFRQPTFLEFVTGGTEISLIVGIDFTGSNGDPSSPSSLHYQNPTGFPNEYMQAIRTVGDVVAPYDNDRMFPAYGFGANLTTMNRTSHCFALNGNEQNPFCYGIDGVLSSYVSSFSWLTLSGPTNFAPIITNVCNLAAQSPYGDKYYILLMITDGVITDLNETLAVLRRAVDLPVSIIIVGVGNAGFENMDVLDDDDGKLGFKRDVVQFVPFRNYKTVPIAKLAKDTLVEIPKQLVSYMTQHGIQPRPRQEYVSPPPQQVQQLPPPQQ